MQLGLEFTTPLYIELNNSNSMQTATHSPPYVTRINTSEDFTSVVHTRENKKSNEIILNGCRHRLSKNCQVLYNALISGERLTGSLIVSKYKMLEYRRRLKDLKDYGIPIEERILENGCKEWWID